MRLVQLTANHPTFKPVTFRNGLNVILAVRTDQSGATDSRNGVGKTTLINIIDFCLGGSVRDGDALARVTGHGWEFTLTLSHGDREVAITRALDDSTDVRAAGEISLLVEDAKSALKPRPITLRQLSTGLGTLAFNLDEEDREVKFGPSFRSLFTHLARWRTSAFASPLEGFARQKTWQTQVNNSFLFGLNWRLAAEREELRSRDRNLKAAAAVDADELSSELSSVDSQLIVLRAQERRLATQIEHFTVLDEYHDVERRANVATRSIQALMNDQVMASRQVELYQEELQEQVTLSLEDVEAVFAEAEVYLPQSLKKTLQEVQTFHEAVTKNRRFYLAGEVRRLQLEQQERELELQEFEARRSEDLSLLDASGALEELSILQKRAAETTSELRYLEQHAVSLRKSRTDRTTLKKDIAAWRERIDLDLDERRAAMDSAIEQFNDIFIELYGEEALLSVDSEDSGYVFRYSLPRQGSHGVEKIAIFALDVSRARKSPVGIPLLIHDSLIFDGVDERQTAGAIREALRSAAGGAFQYVLALNSDDLPTEEMEALGVDIASHVVLELSDEDETAGLLGVRY